MKSLTKLSLALSLALIGGAGSISALAMATEAKPELHKVTVEISENENVSVLVDIKGEVTNVVIPKSSLHDQEKLAEALSGVPEEVREKLLADMGNLHIETNVAKLHELHELHEFDGEDDVNWMSNGGEHIVIINADSESNDHDVDIHQMVRKFKHGDENTIVVKHSGEIGAEVVLSLINDANFSAADLDKIQQAIDLKR